MGTPIGTLTLLFILGMLAAILIGLLSKGWVTAFGYLSTIGTIPLLLIYSLLNLAVIFYKKEKWPFHKKYLFPSLGLLSILIPIWAMVQPGQPEPVSYFPWIVLALCVVSFIYSWFTVKKKSPISANFRPLLKKKNYRKKEDRVGNEIVKMKCGLAGQTDCGIQRPKTKL